MVIRMEALMTRLEGASQDAAPYRHGTLKSEIHSKVYSDNPDRVAGYVQVYAPSNPKDYAKAATLEYGSDKVRRRFDRSARTLSALLRQRRQVIGRSGPVHIDAYRYLRGPFEAMRPEIEAALNEEIAAEIAAGGDQ